MLALLVSLNVLALIILGVHDSSQNPVSSPLRTSSTLNEASQPFVLRNVTLNFDLENLMETKNRIARWSKDPVAQKTIQSSTSPWRPEPYDSDSLDYTPLAKLLVGLKAPKEFTFACHHPIPLVLLDALDKHQPTVHLHIENWTRRSPSTPFGDPVELKLAESSILRAIHAPLSYGHEGMDLQRPAFDCIVTLAPNLHYESRHIGGCVVYGLSLKKRYEEGRQTALFQVQNPKRKVLKAVHLGSSLSSHLLNSQPLLDWSKLHILTGVTIDKSFLESPLDGSELASLKFLSVEFGWPVPENTVYDNFFATLNPLESLTVIDGLKHISLPMLLAHHGDSLRSLHIHEVESPQGSERRRTLTLAELNSIRQSCPQLQDLSIDVDRTVSREHEASIYGIIRQMPLTDITIHLDMGLPLISAPWDKLDEYNKVLSAVYPELGPEDVAALWDALGGGQSTKLQKLTVYVGEPDRSTEAGYPVSWVRREQQKRRRFIAKRNERNETVIIGFPGLNTFYPLAS